MSTLAHKRTHRPQSHGHHLQGGKDIVSNVAWNLEAASIVLGGQWCWLASTNFVRVVSAVINIIMTTKFCVCNIFQTIYYYY